MLLQKRNREYGEGSSKFITINVKNCKTEKDAKKIAFSISNSPLVKTAIAGEDPNWGRVIMAIGKAGVSLILDNLSIKFGNLVIIQNGKLNGNYNEIDAAEYMKNENITITIDLGLAEGACTVWTCDLTHGYISINADYRS